MKILLIVIFLFSLRITSFSQDFNYSKSGTFERKNFSSKMNFKASAETNNYDIIYHRIVWDVNPSKYYIKGEVTSYFKATATLTNVYFDLIDNLTVGNVQHNGNNLLFTQVNNLLNISLPNPLNIGQVDSVTIIYEGIPQSLTGFGSFETSFHEGTPVLWTLSEPYGAREWWPCKQSLTDKIDSIDIYIKSPSAYKAASNGKLISEKIDGSTKTTYWKHRYPIAAYLVAMAVTNYSAYSQYAYVDDKNTVEILNYVYPENLISAQSSTKFTIKVMELFSKLFIPYPFYTEKYGHAQFGWGGGMEHQTMGFMGGFSEHLITHELAHQWFGDHVTCGSWEDIWINEGFAVFCENVAQEHLYPNTWVQWKKSLLEETLPNIASGSVFVDDTTDVSRIFSGSLTYNKGGLIIQLLRNQIGDVPFFSGINQLLTNPKTSGGFATANDVQLYLEDAADTSLTAFFKDWYYGQGYPTYKLKWTQDLDFTVHLMISQTTTHESVPFFKLKVPILFKNGSQQTTTTFMNTENDQSFMFNPGFVINELIFDPNYDIIAPHPAQISVGIYETALNNTISIFPNPSKEKLYIKTTKETTIIKYDIIDAAGKQISNATWPSHSVKVSIDIMNLTIGIYYLRLETTEGLVIKKFVKAN